MRREKKREKERDLRAGKREEWRGRGGRGREASEGAPKTHPQAPGSQHVLLCLQSSNLYAN